jgi:hypothetical protein
LCSEIQHGNTSAVTVGVMIKVHPKDAYNLSKHGNNILTTEVSIKLVFRKVLFGGSD